MKRSSFVLACINWLSALVIIVAVANLFYKNKSECSAPVQYAAVNVNNGCVPNAILFQDAYNDAVKVNTAMQKNHWSRLIIVTWATSLKHAVTVFEWEGGIYAYDATFGSFVLTRDLSKKEDEVYLGVVFSVRLGRVCEDVIFVGK